MKDDYDFENETYLDAVGHRSGDDGIVLTDEQEDAVEQVLQWASDMDGSNGLRFREFSLGGYAGTGKTTILKRIRALMQERGKVQVLAPTGKAAEVLRRKGIPAETIHSYFYRYLGSERNDDGEAVPIFHARHGLDDRPDWVVVDESSMVNEQVAEDVRRHSIPILWVGDHGQLPPVGKDPKIMASPDATLETIHRQAAGNPIILVAHNARKGSPPQKWLLGNMERRSKKEQGEVHVVRKRGDERTIVQYAVDNAIDQILVGKNRTRHSINIAYRESMRFPDPEYPHAGDKVICLKNNRRRGIFNGNTFKVVEIVDYFRGASRKDSVVVLAIENDGGRVIEVPCWAGNFLATSSLDDEEMGALEAQHAHAVEDFGPIEFFDFAYAITVHKSQGSEWDRVLVVDEAFGERARWRYTAITRARNFCAIFC